MKDQYKDLTLEKLTETIKEFQKEHPTPRNMECRELTPDEIIRYRQMLGGILDGLGDRLFIICGAITGIGGWNQFQKALKQLGDGTSTTNWATRKEQALNLSSNVILVWNDQRKTMSEWADHWNVPYDRFRYLVNKYIRNSGQE